MKKFLFLAIVGVFICSIVNGQDYETFTVDIWDEHYIPLNKEHISLTETADSTGKRISQISVPRLYVYRKKHINQQGPTLLYIPGGGYSVVMLRNNGESVARHFMGLGFDVVAVLKYRLPDSRIVNEQHKVPLYDAQMALALLHRNSAQWHVDKEKIAVLGSSAGGHLAACLANLKNDIVAPGVNSEELEQAVSILIYPVISFNLPYRHSGSYKRLLGERSEDNTLLDYYSMENSVSMQTPPTYLIHSVDDATVPHQNSELYLNKLVEFNVKNGYLKLKKGGHGFGLNFSKTGVEWTAELKNWLDGIEFFEN